ncbi:hypothetical protein ILUMI_01903 [Ignelater luminosus]|uniref:Uncharacterized protein n=1 Tax=Ignelater luminosus TaxID=2038154 RepID=A0A8K0DHE3_IGNLU|nr:hypothetical protein ILUMI_01903 [Ignelater luminosus]
MGRVKCCADGCKINAQPQHQFPNPKKDWNRYNTYTSHQLLQNARINIRKDMTPPPKKKRILYTTVKKLSKRLKQMKETNASFKRRLFEAKQLVNEKSVEETLTTLNRVAAGFIECQLREANKSPKQHRFTTDDKILALTLFKKSSKAYRFLSKTISNAAKYINVIWDEMSIAPAINFNEKRDCIEGFHDFGKEKRLLEIDDHELVFIVRGLKTRIKQPISYAFSSKGDAKAQEIKEILQKLLGLLIKIGFKPVVTKIKCAKEKRDYSDGRFEIDGFKIFPQFDPPHLLKRIRNNFLNRNIQYGTGLEKSVAKWKHIVKLYEIDNASNIIDGLKALSHLTDQHVYKDKIKTMKVKYAAQIFSQRLAVTLTLAGKFGDPPVIAWESEGDLHVDLGLQWGSTSVGLYSLKGTSQCQFETPPRNSFLVKDNVRDRDLIGSQKLKVDTNEVAIR